ncbi:MAG: hypothetical protein IPK70_09955 [Flavobacteriales bacterium]|jgi:hypothetical protein|nr:hypothetical protein [Flavobacteriales bacterium]
MNLCYADTIPIRTILDKLGLEPVAETCDHAFFLSPFNPHHPVPSLKVDHRSNTWSDTSTSSKGGPFEMVQAWLVHQGFQGTEEDVLHWLRFNIGYPSLVTLFGLTEGTPLDTYTLLSKTTLQEGALIRYAMRQGIARDQAGKMFKQIHVRSMDTGEEFKALGYRNEVGGYAIYSPHVAGMTPIAAISFIRGREHKPEGVNVFKNIFDYYAVMRSRQDTPFDQDSIILHDYACADDAATYIRGYRYKHLYSWFPADERGRRTTEAFDWLCGTEPDLKHRAMSLDM